MATISQIKGFFALAITQGKTKLISNLNENGYPTSLNIGDQELVDKLYSIFIEKGSSEIEKFLVGIPITNLSQEQLAALRETLTGEKVNTNTRNFWDDLQKIWAGTSSSTGPSSTTTSKPAINPVLATIVLIIMGSIVAVIAFKS